jgi:hypothetical protein
MHMWRHLCSVLAGLLLGAACVVLAIFLHRQGIILAGAWAGVIGLLGIPIGALGVWLAWPRGENTESPIEQKPQAKVQRNETSGGGTIFAVQDGNQIIYNKQSADNITDVPKRVEEGKSDGNYLYQDRSSFSVHAALVQGIFNVQRLQGKYRAY